MTPKWGWDQQRCALEANGAGKPHSWLGPDCRPVCLSWHLLKAILCMSQELRPWQHSWHMVPGNPSPSTPAILGFVIWLFGATHGWGWWFSSVSQQIEPISMTKIRRSNAQQMKHQCHGRQHDNTFVSRTSKSGAPSARCRAFWMTSLYLDRIRTIPSLKLSEYLRRRPWENQKCVFACRPKEQNLPSNVYKVQSTSSHG